LISIKPHYTSAVKALIRLFDAGALTNVEHIWVEPEFGFVAQVRYKNSHVRYVHGASVDVNSDGAHNVATAKDYAKTFLIDFGYHTPHGQAFLLPRRVAELQSYLETNHLEVRNTFDAVPDYVMMTVGLPCFIKPNDGYRGVDVYRCTSMPEVHDALKILETRTYNLIIVEEAINLPEYRVVIYDGQFIACYSKSPLSVRGDGHSTIAELLRASQQAMLAAGRKLDLAALEPHIESRLKRSNLTEQSVIPDGQSLQLLDMANLSVGGSTEDFTNMLHPDWQALCIQIASDLNLRLVGIDFMCANITRPDADYTIIEVNAAPSLNNYASIGPEQAKRVDALYQSIFNSPT